MPNNQLRSKIEQQLEANAQIGTQSLPLSEELLQRAPHEEEIERRRKLLEKVKTLRDAVLINRGKVEGDPTRQYIWVNKREERQIYFQSLGFKIVRDDADVVTSYRQPDGTHSRGDLILYEIDKEMCDAMNDYNALMGLELIQGHQDAFIVGAGKLGVPTFVPKR